MPRIPTRDSLRQGVPQSTGGIVQAPRDFVGGALEGVGNRIFNQAGEALQKEKQQQSALELARARSEWNTSLLTEQSSYSLDQNPDYEGWSKRYETRSPILQKRASANISDPEIRKQFVHETENDRVRVGLGIGSNAREAANTARLKAADTSLEQLLNNAVQVDDETAKGIFSDIRITRQGLVDAGVITAEKAAADSVRDARRFAAIRGRQMVDNDPVQARFILSGEEASAASLIRRFEGFRSTPYRDVSAQRAGYGSDTITTPSGQVVEVRPGMMVSRADAERDLERRIGELQGTIRKQAGHRQFADLAPNVQAALTSVAYNYGSLPDNVAGAVKSGDTEKIAAAIEARGANNGGITQKRWLEEAAVVRGVDGNAYGLIERKPLWARALDAQSRVALLDAADREVQRLDNQRTLQDRVRV